MKVLTNRTISSFISKLSDSSISPKDAVFRINTALSFIQWLSTTKAVSESDSIRYRNELYKAKHEYTRSKAPLTQFPLTYVGLSLAILSLFLIGGGLYLRFYKNVKTPFAFSIPVRAGRIISFQGRMTDTLGNPITAPIDVTYKFYTVPTGGSVITDSTRVCTAGPDQDGVFNSLIGNDSGGAGATLCNVELPSSIFTENTNVYLGVTIGTEPNEMTPRQQIANVGYAINSETLQGMPPGSNVSNVPFINSAGDMLIAAANPGIRSISNSNFVISSALATTIQSAGSGDITLSASEGGALRFKTYNGTLEERITVLNTGRVGIGTVAPRALLDVNGDATVSGSLIAGGIVKVGDFNSAPSNVGSGSLYYDNATNKVYFWNTTAWTEMGAGGVQYWQQTLGSLAPTDITNDLNLGAVATASATVHLPGLTNKDAFFNLGTGNVGIGLIAPAAKLDILGNLNVSTYATMGASLGLGTSNAAAGPGNLDMSGNLTISGAIKPGGASGASGEVLTSSAGGVNTWTNILTTVGGINQWQQTLGSLYPINSTLDLFIGGQSTASAKFAVLNINSGTPTASIAGNMIIGQGGYLGSQYGPLNLAYKSGLDTWTTGLSIEDTTGNITLSSLASGIVHSTLGVLSSSTLNLATEVSGLLTSTNGGTGVDNSAAAQYSVPYYSATGVLGGVLTPGTAGYILSTNDVGGAPTWIPVSTAGTNYWNIANGSLFPVNATLDAFIGGQATASAKFAFLNVNSGTPTASVSGTVANVNTFVDGNGNISTTNRQNLVLGNSATYNSTGNILLNPNGTGNVGIGTTNPGAKLDVSGNLNVSTYATMGASLALGTSNAAAGPGNLDMSGNLTLSSAFKPGGLPGTAGEFLISGGIGAPPTWTSTVTATSIPFSGITSATNTTAAMVVGAGATLDYTSTGTINASSLIGGTWAIPGTIGSTTPNSGAFTSLSSTGLTSLGNNSTTVDINSSDWDINTTGDMTGIGALTMNGNFSQGGATTFGTGTGIVSLNGDTTFAGKTTLNTIQYTWPGAQTTDFVLKTDGSGGLAWADASTLVTGASQYWQQTLGSLAPTNITDALNLGAIATSSALVHLPGTDNADAWFNLGTGNVGIGTNAPTATYKLDVVGKILATELYDRDNASFYVNPGGASSFSGNLTLGGDLRAINATASGTITVGDGTTNVIRAPFGALNLDYWKDSPPGYVHGITLTQDTGRVGIGIENPDYALDVVGNIKLSSGLIAGVNGPGSTGQVLVSAAGGVNTWSDITSLAPGANLWQRTSGSLAPKNITDALNLGAIATSSALVHFPGTNNQDAFLNLGTGNVGIGTTAPTAGSKLDVRGRVLATEFYDYDNSSYYVNPAGAGLSVKLNGTIEMNGDITMLGGAPTISTNNGGVYTQIILKGATDTLSTSLRVDGASTGDGKIDVGTIDPPYTINGKKYATYLPSMTGVKEETTGHVTLTTKSQTINGYEYTIDFNTQEDGSDLWLFAKTTALRNRINRMTVLLSPSDNARTWYKIDNQHNILTLYASRPTTISYRLTAPRFDDEKWKNSTPNGSGGFVINDPDVASQNDMQIDGNGNITGQLIASAGSDGGYQVLDEMGTLVEETVLQAKTISAHIVAGLISAQKIVSPLAEIDTLKTNEIKPTNGDLVINLNTNTNKGQLAELIIKGLNNTPVVRIDAEGNASFSGNLASQSLTTETATISGTLIAKNIQSENISDLENRMNVIANEVKQSQTQIASSSATPRNDTLAEQINTIQSELASLKNQPLPNPAYYQNIDASYSNLTVNDTANIYKAHIADSLVVGTLFIQPSSILALSSDLRISSLGTIRLFDDSVIIAKNGDIASKGEISAVSLAIKNTDGITVASIDASGSAKFNEVIARKFTLENIATQGALITDSGIKNEENLPIPAIKTSTEVAGTGTLPQDVKEVIIYNDNVTANSLIYLTPTTDNIQGQLSVTKKITCPSMGGDNPAPTTCTSYFIVSSNNAIHSASAFNWLIIN